MARGKANALVVWGACACVCVCVCVCVQAMDFIVLFVLEKKGNSRLIFQFIHRKERKNAPTITALCAKKCETITLRERKLAFVS